MGSRQPLMPTAQPILHGPDRPEFLRAETLADLFEATAARLPHKTALICGERRLGYAELDEAADRIAHRLIEAGVRAGDMVGLWLPRGIELLAAQLGIAKTGAAWLPFDADAPPERIAACLDDAQARLLLIDAPQRQRLAAASGLAAEVVTVQTLLAPLGAAQGLRRREGSRPEHPAYVIYTSGSTGKPKGIAITQASICHFLRSENARLGVREDDRVYQGFSVAFDMSFEEIWISYLVGATLWIAPREIAGDPEALPRALIENDISVLHAVPTLLALFAQDVPGLRLINLGGEMCPQPLVDQWATPGRQLFNTYGPTEATVSASLAELRAGEPVTIGQPLPNYGLLVIEPIDADAVAGGVPPPLRLLPFGATGELCITGPGVAAGYLGRPELTAEKFLPNPWARDAREARLYRTGDLARVEPAADGTPQVQCLGRSDDQVKVRGFRVELGEIEAVLAALPGVGTAAVLLRAHAGIEQLVAFYVPAAGTPPAARELRAALAEKLPPYMVPAFFEPLAAMPRLQSGKVDRKALKSRPLAAPAPAEGSDSPATAAEELLFAALQKLFAGQPIRRELDFFDDLGGHSLLAARLISALRQDPRLAQAAVGDIYAHRRIGAIALALQAAMVDPGAAAERPFLLHSRWRRWRCGIAQGLAIPLLVLLNMAQWLAPFFTYHFYTGDVDDTVVNAVAMSVLAFLAAIGVAFVLAAAGRRLLAGRLQAGSYPLWGLAYFRWWLGDRLADVAPTYLLTGSALLPAWLRLLGARVGPDVVLGSTTLRVPHLVSIGAGSSIGNGVNLENARVEGGRLHLGRIDIGANACIGSYVVIEGGAPDDEVLRALTAVSPDHPGLVLHAALSPEVMASRLTRGVVNDVEVEVPNTAWVYPQRFDALQAGDDVLVYAGLEAAYEGDELSVQVRGGEVDRAFKVPLAPTSSPLLGDAWSGARAGWFIAQARSSCASTDRGLCEAWRRQALELSAQHRIVNDLTALVVLPAAADFARFGLGEPQPLLAVGADGLEWRPSGWPASDARVAPSTALAHAASRPR